RSMNIFKTAWRAIDIALAMSGLRLDAGRFLFAWLPLLGASVWLAYRAEQSGCLVEHAFASWAFYYLGISLILGTRIKRVMLSLLGQTKATRVYDMICGLMFFNIGCGVGTAALYAPGAAGFFQLYPLLKWGLVGLLVVAGFGIKIWSTWIVGIDTYFFRDLFLEQAHGEFTAKGPYKWLANPMYGVGNLHIYCFPLVTGSTFGLWFALGCHVSIYAFYFIVEKPFIRRAYGTG
ncbi:MAG TPA: methyltransferase, partial [Verrucomicrobiota bacterium]|nr:methyltransferase [Verrucomicrobiota bacterium]